MRRLSINLILFQTVLCTLISVNFAFGDTPSPPCSYKATSSDGLLTFVMLAPRERTEVECIGQTDRKVLEASAVRKSYRYSGMYKTGSGIPEWTVDWYSPEILVPNNGGVVVRFGGWASTGDDEAFSIIGRRGIIKAYSVKDLITRIDRLPRSTSHFIWKDAVVLNDGENTLTITTAEEMIFIFNLGTGELSSSTRVSRETGGDRFKCANLLIVLGLACLARRSFCSIR